MALDTSLNTTSVLQQGTFSNKIPCHYIQPRTIFGRDFGRYFP